MGRHAAVNVPSRGSASKAERPAGSPRRTVDARRHSDTAKAFSRSATAPAAAVQSAAVQPTSVQAVQAVAAASVAGSAPLSFRKPSHTGRRIVLPLVGFAATFAFLSASLVNPLSGAVAATVPAADASAAAGVATVAAGQSYSSDGATAPSASRDAYTVVYTPPVVVKAPVAATTATTATTAKTASTAKAATTTAAPTAAAPSPGTAQAAGAAAVAAHGWGTDQYNCLVSLWNRESGWNVYASNKSSGAYGIPQALPGSKMASFGADWQTNPATQIAWGLSYITGRYQTPCGAWAHSQSTGWY
ncbi:aggregation-promoting factor C-terminal-like domain-containing protein [Frondihabitans cladoniiphilus]|uniref:Transglycosylase-like protein with SLT domain n=1 Tax=Frondihabitans cladoniiphilus TaxID=715785 RepID=A0ABP8VMA4_9MICO